MSTYTVHAPPRRDGIAADPQRFAFVRDGFYFWAFLLTPIWMLYRRLWLAFALYLVLIAALAVTYYLLNLPPAARILIQVLLSILIGLEAGTLRRWTYARRRWTTIGVVSARNLEDAERRFFSRWVEDDKAVAAPSPAVAPVASRPMSSDVIGLFPEPGGRA
jgi:hypothetical protein